MELEIYSRETRLMVINKTFGQKSIRNLMVEVIGKEFRVRKD